MKVVFLRIALAPLTFYSRFVWFDSIVRVKQIWFIWCFEHISAYSEFAWNDVSHLIIMNLSWSSREFIGLMRPLYGNLSQLYRQTILITPEIVSILIIWYEVWTYVPLVAMIYIITVVVCRWARWMIRSRDSEIGHFIRILINLFWRTNVVDLFLAYYTYTSTLILDFFFLLNYYNMIFLWYISSPNQYPEPNIVHEYIVVSRIIP